MFVSQFHLSMRESNGRDENLPVVPLVGDERSDPLIEKGVALWASQRLSEIWFLCPSHRC